MLRGTLDTFSADEILGLVGRAKASGVLQVVGTDAEGAVYCDAGDVTFVTADTTDDLAAVLARGGFLDGGDAVDARALNDYLKSHAEDAMFELALWDSGQVRFHEGLDPRLAAGFRYPIDSVLWSVGHRRREWNRLLQILPGPDAVVRQVEVADDDGDLTLTRAQLRVLVAADGRRAVRDLARDLHLGLFYACKTIVALIEQGMLAVANSEPTFSQYLSPPAPAPLVSAVHGVAAHGATQPVDLLVAEPSFPAVDFVDAREAPSRDLILQLLSAVKEL